MITPPPPPPHLRQLHLRRDVPAPAPGRARRQQRREQLACKLKIAPSGEKRRPPRGTSRRRRSRPTTGACTPNLLYSTRSDQPKTRYRGSMSQPYPPTTEAVGRHGLACFPHAGRGRSRRQSDEATRRVLRRTAPTEFLTHHLKVIHMRCVRRHVPRCFVRQHKR